MSKPKNTASGTLTARRGGPLRGAFKVPGDKSISHRALMLAALAVGETTITGLLEGDDVRHTAAALELLGVAVTRDGLGAWRVNGVGIGGLTPPDDVIDLGNSGTAARLLCGLLAGHGFSAVLTGDASLRSRPMGRVVTPLTAMGVTFQANDGERMPLTVAGSDNLRPTAYTLPVASAQVKSAVLLAGLHAPGETSVVETTATRDHTERMLGHFGAEIRVEDVSDQTGRRITITGQPELAPAAIAVPADPSSAAFPTVAALLVPGSEITLPGICTNPTRTGLYASLAEMGADLTWRDERVEGGEPVADLTVTASALAGVEVPAARAPAMIDEYPVLAMAAACAEGTTVFHGVGELRHKESDRLAAVAAGLAACGVAVEEGPDSLTIQGAGGAPAGGATIEAALDHRIAMSFLVLGLASENPISIDDGSSIETSFPDFAGSMAALGADIGPDE
ncbi:MAG: 3-phosphoshikimate 1-carboxyvinyltransferase [Alphaproteobacteria bacterium]|nr:3-phosphoshikimate 1-carboxyvinyltransferase [Alphaproteobacteria bacterium]